MTKDEALRMALDALEADPLEMVADVDGHMVFLKDKAITAIKKSLAQTQDPVAWGVFEGNLHDMFFSPSEAQEMADLKGTHAEVRPLYTTPPVLAQPEQESFEYWNAVEGWVKIDEVRKHFDSVGCGTIYKTAGEDRTPLYTTPQRTWVGLTAKEKHEIRYSHMTSAEFIEVIEAKLKQKNGYVEEKNT